MQAKVEDKSVDLSNTEAKGAYEVAMKRADGAHEIAIQKCYAFVVRYFVRRSTPAMRQNLTSRSTPRNSRLTETRAAYAVVS